MGEIEEREGGIAYKNPNSQEAEAGGISGSLKSGWFAWQAPGHRENLPQDITTAKERREAIMTFRVPKVRDTAVQEGP